MKKLMKAFASLIIGLAFLTSCQQQGVITISLNPSDQTLDVTIGDTVTWIVTLAPDPTVGGAIGLFTVSANGTVFHQKDFLGAKESVTDTVEYTVPTDLKEGDVINIEFKVVDAKTDSVTSVVVVLNVHEPIYYLEANGLTFTYISTDLNNQMMLVLTKDGVSFEGGTSTAGQVAYLYVYDENGLVRNTLASPNADEIRQAYAANTITYTTDDKQETYFKRITGQYTWDQLTADVIHSLDITAQTSDVIAGNPDLGYGVSVLQVGDIVAFYNPATGVKGVILVKRYDYAKSGAKITSTMDIDVKYLVYPVTTAK